MNYPAILLDNNLIRAKLFLPDPHDGYYRGSRFDWAGVLTLEDANGNYYFDQWRESHDPLRHDCVSGPVEEFEEIGYHEAPAGGEFIKIGIGTLRKQEDAPYAPFHTYQIVDAGLRTTEVSEYQARFGHQLRSDQYGYTYQKEIAVAIDRPILTISHMLENTGERVIKTNVYNHNFLTLPKLDPENAISVKFPFSLVLEDPEQDLFRVCGGEIQHVRPLEGEQRVFIPSITGFGPLVSDHAFSVESRSARLGVSIFGDTPLEKLRYWACTTAVCPEPYVRLEVAPGEQASWSHTYEFYMISDTSE
jgi:hypothetical protein